MLPGVAILEAVGTVGELELLPTLHRVLAVLAFVQPGEVAQVTLTVRSRPMCGQLCSEVDFERSV